MECHCESYKNDCNFQVDNLFVSVAKEYIAARGTQSTSTCALTSIKAPICTSSTKEQKQDTKGNYDYQLALSSTWIESDKKTSQA